MTCKWSPHLRVWLPIIQLSWPSATVNNLTKQENKLELSELCQAQHFFNITIYTFFWSKIFSSPNFSTKNNLQNKFLWTKFFSNQNFLNSKFLLNQFFLFEIVFGPNLFATKAFGLSPKFLCNRIFVDPNYPILLKLQPKIFCTKNVLNHKSFWAKKLFN